MPTPAKTRTIAYIRVSGAQQAEGGSSLEAQRRKLEAYAVAMDLELVATIVDAAESAGTMERPGMRRALRALESGEATALLVAKLDRLTRSVADLGWLLDAKRFGGAWTLLSVGDSIDTRSAGGRLVLNVLASVSQWEREAIGERTREVLGHLKATGVALGAPALGQRRATERGPDGRKAVVADAEELRAVAAIQRWRAAGMTLRAIASKLERDGHATKRGGAWHASTVRQCLKRCA